MAYTNVNAAATNTTDAGSVRAPLKAQPCMRSSFRPQTFLLADTETAWLQWGEAITDDIPRVFLVTVKEDDAAIEAAHANLQSCLLTIYKTEMRVDILLQDGGAVDTTPIIALAGANGAGTESDAAAANTMEFGYDATGDPDGNPVYYMTSGFGSVDTMVSIVRLDGYTADDHTLGE